MKIVIQRVSTASVAINGDIHSGIQRGLLILVGVGHEDTHEDAEYLAAKAWLVPPKDTLAPNTPLKINGITETIVKPIAPMNTM